MKNNFKYLFIIFIVAVVLDVVMRPGSGGGKYLVHWRNDLAAAREEAKTSHRPLFVEFGATWCGPCQDMKRKTWGDKAVADELNKMVPVRIDIDAQHETAQAYHITAVPAYLIEDASTGAIIRTGDGYRDPKDFLAWLHQPSIP